MGIKACIGTCFSLTVILVATASRIQSPRIVNGEVATEGQFPWQVGVVNVANFLLKYCGGALISEQWVLTAAHCIYDADSIIILYGTLNLEDNNNNVSVSSDYVVHGEYDNDTLRNDIGLIYLQSPLELNDKVQPISLAEKDLEAGTEATVIGWGATSDHDNSEVFDVLRYISVTTIDNEDCVDIYGPSVINPSVVCTAISNPARNPCEGDGGDPLVVNSGTNPVHVGLFSFLSSLGCESSIFPAGYTRTAYYRDWIKNVSGV